MAACMLDMCMVVFYMYNLHGYGLTFSFWFSRTNSTTFTRMNDWSDAWSTDRFITSHIRALNWRSTIMISSFNSKWLAYVYWTACIWQVGDSLNTCTVRWRRACHFAAIWNDMQKILLLTEQTLAILIQMQ